MEVMRSADRPRRPGPAEWFTGAVEMLPIVAPGALLVTFQPGARTAWHTHPRGQTLHVVTGVARVGRADGTTAELEPGDAVTFAPGERHWHGATSAAPMAHVALAEPDEHGEPTYWAEHVSDAEYGA